MANSVTTPYGPGVVVESQTVRGREEYRVEGNDFTVWLTAAQIPEFGFMIWDETPSHEWDNSTTLPYNPTPQFPAWSNGESTVQPTHHLDPNKRTSPADSVHFSSRVADVDDNSYEDFSYESPVTDEEFPGGVNVPEDHSVPGDFALGSRRTGLNDGWELDGPGSWIKNYGDDDYTFAVIEEGDDDYSWRVEEDESGALVDDGFEADLDAAMGAADSAYQGARHGSAVDLQARLGPKYVDIPVDVDRSSLQARLDEDPVRVVADIKAANAEKIADLDPRIGQALDLELSDPELRSSAWSDVRAKASRLRRSGNVQVEAANPTSIVAVVTGDHGIYDVAVLRGSALTGSSAVTEWTCSCPWGDWAFERQHTYVGRLCSHAYASLLELRAMQMRRNKGPHWSGTASRKEADRLVTQPWRLSPDLHQIPLQHDTERVDVTNTTEDGDWRTFGVSTAARMRLGLHGRKHYVQPTRWGKAVLDLLDEPGFTFHDFPGDAPSSGYMVSVNPEAEHILPEYDVTSDDLGEYMDIWGWELHDPNKFIGGWVHQGKLYLDISTWEPSLEDAALLAKAHNQIAIYDLTNDQEIMTDDALATSVGVAASKQAFMDEPYLIGPDSFGSSGDYVSEHEGPYEDLNGPEFNPVVRNGAVDEEHHARLGHLLEGNSGQGNDDIAQAAQAFLKTAGRQFTLAEQQELMDEEGLGGPIEASDLDLSGTHYL